MEGNQASGGPGSRPQRLPKGQRRMLSILKRIPPAREQLIVAIEEISPEFELNALIAAAESSDPRERNKLDTAERGTEKLIQWMEELAFRALSEGVRLGVFTKTQGGPWERLAQLGVIHQTTVNRLREAKDARNDLAHAYPPESYRALLDAARTVLNELDAYTTAVSDWAAEKGILPASLRHG